MINTTHGNLVFAQKDQQLNTSIIVALRLASKWVLKSYGLESLDLGKVNTKSYREAIFPALVEDYILRDKKVVFTEEYVQDVFEFLNAELDTTLKNLYSRITIAETDGKRAYRKSYLAPLRRSFSAFFVALHIQRTVVLPYSFKWPIGLTLGPKGRKVSRREICPVEELPELLGFMRSLDYQAETHKEEVFNTYNFAQRKRIAEYGLHLVIAAGWLTPSDANYDDLVALYEANAHSRFANTPNLACLMLADLLETKYRAASPINAAGWQMSLSRSRALSAPVLHDAYLKKSEGMTSILQQTIAIPASQMAPVALAQITRLPGIGIDMAAITKTWLAIENVYLKKVKRESNKARVTAIGHLNAYLFVYLPYWFEAHPEFQFEFPGSPSKLLGAVYVSDLGLLGAQNKPVTLVEFLAMVAKNREWGNACHYAYLKQLEIFFSFIERISHQLPGCAGFQQVISDYDFPNTTRSYGTNKRPIPRRIFKFYLLYIEAITTFVEAFVQRILSGLVPDDEVARLKSSRKVIIDCFKDSALFGFVPVLFFDGKILPIRYIPNVLFVNVRRLKDGRVLNIPHPHALHQILVALYTGVRHNHIQWLDANTFDMCVVPGEGRPDRAILHVNTDKVKRGPWRPHVDFRVIEILRAQLAWRGWVGEPEFNNKVFYNNNPDSKWGQFYLLFAFNKDGSPHSDAIYSSAWTSLLGGIQGMLGSIGEFNIRLLRFLPSPVPYSDPNQAEKLYAYGDKQKRICELQLKTDITPHSARVSVCTHGFTVLPAGLLGRYLTGQTEATVHHYIVPDEEETSAEQLRQAMILRQRGYEQGYEAMIAGVSGKASPFVKADDINSNLAKSLKTNLEEAIAAYGFVSVSLNDNRKTGLDVLRETRASGAVANKTEICPYGNHCPPEVVVALNGFRRCGPCHFAVRSIDHLPAITAKIRQVLEGLTELEARLNVDDDENLTPDEWSVLAKNRDFLAEDLAAWEVAAEVLEVMRQRAVAGESSKIWHIQRPEIIERHLKRVLFPTRTTDYVLARLHESEAFPSLESPQIRVKFDLLRRNLLANVGNIREALRLEQPTNPAAECLGLIRSIAAANQLGIEELRCMLESDELAAVPLRTLRVLR